MDLLIRRNGRLYPLEIKMTANPERRHIAAFGVLDAFPAPYERGEGGLVCCYGDPVSLGGPDRVVPPGYL
ncbi:MAG: hypothetical protein LBT87_07390 [Treponema sp.]|nr:hypothetical protein [Treponema sp.]